MTSNSLPDLSILARWDTPTICNALELIVPERRGHGFTVEQVVCLDPTLEPIVGYARTARCSTRTPPTESAQILAERRINYYEYVAGPPHPTVAVIQDFSRFHTLGDRLLQGQLNTLFLGRLMIPGWMRRGSLGASKRRRT